MDISTERVEIAVPGSGTMGGYLAKPQADAPRPAVVVFMEVFGVNSHIREVTDRIAREGYVALAPDYYHRTAPGVEYGYDDKDLEAGMELYMKLDSDQMIADARAAIDYLKSRSDVKGDAIGCTGFCAGGHMTYLTACETEVKAAACFYGGGVADTQGLGGGPAPLSRTSKIKGKILCLFGGQDAYIPPDHVDATRQELGKTGVRHEIVVYDKADHGFFCDQRDSYDKAAADDAWKRVKRFFAEELGS